MLDYVRVINFRIIIIIIIIIIIKRQCDCIVCAYARGRFPIVIIEFCRCLLRLRRYKRRSVEVGVFRRGWVTDPSNPHWSGKTRDTCISLFRMMLRYWQTLILFCHNAGIWQTDGRTEIQTDRQNCDSNTVRCIAWSRTVKLFFVEESNRLIVNNYEPGNTNQQFHYNKHRKTIENDANSKKVFDVVEEKKDPGADVCAWDYHGKANQHWIIEPVWDTIRW